MLLPVSSLRVKRAVAEDKAGNWHSRFLYHGQQRQPRDVDRWTAMHGDVSPGGSARLHWSLVDVPGQYSSFRRPRGPSQYVLREMASDERGPGFQSRGDQCKGLG